MKNPHDIVVRALLSEKGARMREAGNQYHFEVRLDANKIEIKRAVETIFDVHVEGVRTMVVRGKLKRMGAFYGTRASWKKAIVTLRQGDAIELFEQV